MTMKNNTTNKPSNKKSSGRPAVLAAAVGIGDITLDTVQLRDGRSLRIGGTADCQLPFTCDATDVAVREEGSWRVQAPQGILIDGSEQAEPIRLFDWNSGITMRDGDAWLRLWPTRSEQFADEQRLVGAAISAGKTLPVLWLSLAMTVALGAFIFWASGALSGTGVAATLGQAGYGFGGAPDRVASFGSGDLASAGTPSAHWVSIPTPTEDAVSDEAPIDEPEEEAAEETVEETEDAVAEEDTEEAPEDTDAATQNVTAEAEEAELPRDPKARKAAKAARAGGKGSTKAGGATAGGGGSGGLGGGTDDGFADRSESVRALERMLVACVQDHDAHRVKLSVDTDGQAMLSSVDYSRAGLTSNERACVVAALDDWAFPAGDEEYEISLRMRKSKRGSA